MEKVDCLVIGAGVVGLAVARALALTGREVVVLEACNAIGTQTSARNSEVIHAGIYYPFGSLKASLCVRGKQLLYDYCQNRKLPHKRCGKLIVATTPSQVNQLKSIHDHAFANGVHDLVSLTENQARVMEPALHCLAALHSPSTGILDSHAFMLSLLGDFENAGGILALNSSVDRAECAGNYIEVVANDGTRIRANTVVNSAGLQAPMLGSRFEGLEAQFVPQAYFAKGNYFSLAGKAPFSRLIYPVPEVAGLGVHLTLDMGGQARFGPDVQWVDDPQDLNVEPVRGDAFYAEVRKYWPELPDGNLIPAYAGIRPKINNPAQAAQDFRIDGPSDHGVPGLLNLFGIESPGLTASLAIGEFVLAKLSTS
jgi:L-2-hydroxyglutarate oxidase LhgO